MMFRRTLLLSGAALASTALLLAGARWSSSNAAARKMDSRGGARSPLPVTAAPLPGPPIPCVDEATTSAALEELAMRDPAAALAAALAPADENTRRAQLVAVLRGWARVDLAAAGAWAIAQPWLAHDEAFGALFNGAVSQPDEAVRFGREIDRIHPAAAEACGDALIAALCDVGQYERAVQFAATDAPARMTTLYRRWTEQAPEPAWDSARALHDCELRFAALEAASHAWSQADPDTLAEKARLSPAGPERTLALTMALRAWLEQDLEAASAWLLRWEPTGTLASVDIDLVLED